MSETVTNPENYNKLPIRSMLIGSIATGISLNLMFNNHGRNKFFLGASVLLLSVTALADIVKDYANNSVHDQVSSQKESSFNPALKYEGLEYPAGHGIAPDGVDIDDKITIAEYVKISDKNGGLNWDPNKAITPET